MKKRERVRRMALRTAAVATLLAVFALYFRPNLALTLATQIWSCF